MEIQKRWLLTRGWSLHPDKNKVYNPDYGTLDILSAFDLQVAIEALIPAKQEWVEIENHHRQR